MKVSLSWMKDYLDIALSPEEIADKLTALGIEAVFENTGKSFSGVVLGKVLECTPHENADKLSVCQIDIGNAATEMTARMAEGVPQANWSVMVEPTMNVDNVANAVLYMARLPLDANIQFMTIMATKMPYIGRG